ncbi:MAG TPA: hypothetical protein VHM90_19390, partial [Phycisphaerae bacterium]|nr:hypothetical protein [Phycisphaerae bacterium]
MVDGLRICSVCRQELDAEKDAQRRAAEEADRLRQAEQQRAPGAIIETLQRCGEGRVVASIVYRKPGEEWVTERRVEPYRFTTPWSGGIIVETWQID